MSTQTTSHTTPTADPGLNRLPDDRVARGGALVVRLVAAYLWFDNLGWKIPPNFGEADKQGLYQFTHYAVEYPVFAPYTWVVENLILPNFTLFGWIAFLTEAALFVFLFLGLATRFWAVVGIAQSLVIFLSVGAAPNEWRWSYFLMMATHVAILGFAAGRVFGLDGLLRERLWERRDNRAVKALLLAT